MDCRGNSFCQCWIVDSTFAVVNCGFNFKMIILIQLTYFLQAEKYLSNSDFLTLVECINTSCKTFLVPIPIQIRSKQNRSFRETHMLLSQVIIAVIKSVPTLASISKQTPPVHQVDSVSLLIHLPGKSIYESSSWRYVIVWMTHFEEICTFVDLSASASTELFCNSVEFAIHPYRDISTKSSSTNAVVFPHLMILLPWLLLLLLLRPRCLKR